MRLPIVAWSLFLRESWSVLGLRLRLYKELLNLTWGRLDTTAVFSASGSFSFRLNFRRLRFGLISISILKLLPLLGFSLLAIDGSCYVWTLARKESWVWLLFWFTGDLPIFDCTKSRSTPFSSVYLFGLRRFLWGFSACNSEFWLPIRSRMLSSMLRRVWLF